MLFLAVTACAGQTNSTVPATGGNGATPARAASPAKASVVKTPEKGQQLAVSSCKPCATFQNGPSSEYFFPVGFANPKRIVSNGIAAPWVGLVFDAARDLYVANCTTCLTGQTGVNNVVKLKQNNNTPVLTITNGVSEPFDLALDSSNTLYVSNLGGYSPSSEGSVSEYSSVYTSGSPSAQITVKYPLGLAIDSHQNLYVANCVICSTGQTGSDQILVYAPGQTTPFRTITTGINEPVVLALDSADNLYVANCMNCGLGAGAYVHGTDTVTEYSATGYSPVKTITFSGTDVPFSLAIDKSDDLFVGNYAVNTVTEYPPGAYNPSKTISNGISSPASLAIDAAGTLFVSNAGANTVTTYSANYRAGHPPKKTLSVPYPSSIAVSP